MPFGKQHHQSGGSFSHGLLLVSGTGGKRTIQKKLWGKDNLSRLPGKHGMRGKFSGDRTCLILSPIFKNDDWKGKQKVLRLSDLVLIDLAMPRGYASFHVLDVWGNRAFLSDEKDKLVLCEMTLE